MAITAHKDGDFIVFTDGNREFYDVRIPHLEGYIPQMRLKTWFTPDVEKSVMEIIDRTMA